MLLSPLATLEQRVVLRGPSAGAWLTQRGFTTAEPGADFRLFADTYRAPQLALARIARSPGDVEYGGSLSPAVSFSAVTDGSFDLLSPAGALPVLRGQAVIARTTDTFRTRSTEQVSTIEIQLGDAFAARFVSVLRDGPLRVESNRAGVRAISALVNEVLAESRSIAVPLSGGYRIAVQSLVSDVLQETGADLSSDLGRSDRRLLLRARRLIRARFPDATLSVAALAQELSVSRRHLHRAFSTVDSTPYAMLRQARVDAAEHLLQSFPRVTRVELEQVARDVGLRSARALRDQFAALGRPIPGYRP